MNDRSDRKGWWIRVSPALVLVSFLLGWSGLTLLLAPMPLLPAPLDGPEVAMTAGVLALVTAVGILRAAHWARILGIAITLGFLVATVASAIQAVRHLPDPLSDFWVASAYWLAYVAVYAFMLHRLLLRWPTAAGRGGSRGRAVGVVVVVAVLAAATLYGSAFYRPTELAPLEPLGRFIDSGRVELAGSAFTMTFPDDWTVEVVHPDPDVFGATPGEAWEALRAHDPERRSACSVSVGVATVSLRERSGGASGDMTVEPHWDDRDEGTLWVPEPRIDLGVGVVYSTMTPHARLHTSERGLEHDVMYVASCSAAGDGDPEELETALDGHIETFELRPGRG